jgi:hypothetical protein
VHGDQRPGAPPRPQAATRHKRHALYSERLNSFFYTLAHLLVWLAFIELGLRVWGLSLIRFTEGDGHEVSVKLFSLAAR